MSYWGRTYYTRCCFLRVSQDPQAHLVPGIPFLVRGVFTADSEESVARADVNVVSVSEDRCLTKFWEVEEVPSHSTQLTQVEESVEQHYRDTTRYLSDECRYQVDQALLQPWGRARVKPSKGTTRMRSPSLGKAPAGGSSKGFELGHACEVTDEEMRVPPPGDLLHAHACCNQRIK